jgi:hypothetical protein
MRGLRQPPMSFALLTSGATGFLARAGERMRLLTWLPASAFRVLPWEAPGPADILSALAPGLTDVRLSMPWDEVPSAWTTMDPAPPNALPPSREEPFVVRAEGTLKADRVPLVIPVGKQTLHIAAVWREPKAEPAPPPAPSPPSAPEPEPPTVPATNNTRPTHPSPPPQAPRRQTPEPLPPPRRPRTASALPWALGLGAVVAAVTFVRAPGRRAR